MAPTEKGRSVGISNFEAAHDFTNTAVGKYMAISDIRELPNPKYLMRLAEKMRPSDDPFVQIAAGWAAAEYALFPGISAIGPIPLDNRLQALSLAGDHWTKAAEGLFDRIGTTTDQKVKYQSFNMYGGALHALNSLPAMSIVAGLYSGEPFSDEVRDMRIHSTIQQTPAIAKIVYDMDFGQSRLTKSRHDIDQKLLSALLLQSGKPYEFAFLPAPLRLEFHEDPEQQIDLLAEPLSPLYKRRGIVIIPNPEKSVEEDPRFIIVPKQDLHNVHGVSPFVTLGTFLRMHNGLETLKNSQKDLQLTAGALRAKFLQTSRSEIF